MFTSLAHLAQYAQGVDTSLTIQDLAPALRTARKRIEAIITPAVYNAIAALADSEDTTTEHPLLTPLRTALANQALSTQLVFDSVSRRRSGTDVYKYELEAMRRAYAENYFSAMDTLIETLEGLAVEDGEDDDGVNGLNGENGQDSPSSPLDPLTPSSSSPSSPASLWLSTRHHALLAACRIKTTADLDAIYPIDLSHLFFFRTIALQKETLDERLNAYYERAGEMQDSPSSSTRTLLDLALAKKTIAKALRRFDPLELPPTIRNLVDDTTAPSNRPAETLSALALADRLDQEAEQLLQSIDLLLDDQLADIGTATAHNLPSDNIIMMP